MVSHGRHGAQTRLKFPNGRGIKYREIGVEKRVQVIGRHKSQWLIGLHSVSGADCGGELNFQQDLGEYLHET